MNNESIESDISFQPLQATTPFKHLVFNLLKVEVTSRLGTASVNDIKMHPWFESMSWTGLLEKRIEPPFLPRLHHRGDTRFFDKYDDNFEEILKVLPAEEDSYKLAFQNF